EQLTAALTIRAGAPFFRTGYGVAAHVAIEWMVQACGAYVGVESLRAGKPIRMGLLLGTRDFSAVVPWFIEGQRHQVTARVLFKDAEMGVFDCIVAHTTSGQILAKAKLSVFQSDDIMTMLSAQLAKADK